VFGVDFDSSRSPIVTPRFLISANHLLERSQHSVAVSHPFFRRKPNASHMCARIKISHILTHECNITKQYSKCTIFPKKTECISYVCQDQNFTHIDSWVQYHKVILKTYRKGLLNLITLMRVDMKVFTRTSITMTMRLHLYLPQASDWWIAFLRTPRSVEVLHSGIVLWTA
jgi:hypothetical protein